jgi:hypothetical protein
MDIPRYVASLLSQRYFAEAAYFGGVDALRNRSPNAHLLAGIGCCGCVVSLATAQRLLDGDPVPEGDLGVGPLRVSPATELPYEGLFHLIESVRADPAAQVPGPLREVADAVADDLAYASRREVRRPPDEPRRYSYPMACLAAAVLLRRLTGTSRELPRAHPALLAVATEILETELSGTGGDATFL